ncbi:MAG: shc 2 [Verrucomicrobiales bacterium]|nr:shc 2 [Verrucomicrobiales bacterium]
METTYPHSKNISLDWEQVDRCSLKASAELWSHFKDGHWTGKLSSSPLSTATALVALGLAHQNGCSAVPLSTLRAGTKWLIAHQNPDGGWGDTDLSKSNISTTVLCWSCLYLAPHWNTDNSLSAAEQKAEAWLQRTAGGISPDQISEAILKRYGNDRTFSIPILTLAALCGRLGPEESSWSYVLQLPFELAVLPHRFFTTLKLPVVSYALPALIAMGLVRHTRKKTRSPWSRLRDKLTPRALKVLENIQPSNGGFLEATPLTSFVTMSLIGANLLHHPVTAKGLAFLLQSQRPDGSWPIDTNLATWVTTLGVKALGKQCFTNNNSELTQRWLLRQQYRGVHPYTNARPGGWAWTDLPGGVPDADDTAGALLALHLLYKNQPSQELLDSAELGIEWLLSLQNRDGGIPTFCQGWGALPFDRSSCDITAHTLHAWRNWSPLLNAKLQERLASAMQDAIHFLIHHQLHDGSWIPLWFGNEHLHTEENPTYGTSRVILGLTCISNPPKRLLESLRRGVRWLLENQSLDGGWGAGPNTSSTVEETALALEALAHVAHQNLTLRTGPLLVAVERATSWLCKAVENDHFKNPSPIGFYFAKLWYYEALYPALFTVAAFRSIRQLR